VIDVFFEGRQLDNAQMLMDFGLMKNTIGSWIDSMDHCALICTKDDPEYVEFFKKFNDRYILIPLNPSAEMLSIFIMHYINRILDNTQFENGEGAIRCIGVEYNETVTGMARCDQFDEDINWLDQWEDEIVFSEGVKRDWSQTLRDFISTGKYITNPSVKQQIKLK
jgi:6-pyruvoyltetrahydropterin/6-carboxytetrahydropterin synthase